MEGNSSLKNLKLWFGKFVFYKASGFYKDVAFLFKICSFGTYRNSVVQFYLHNLRKCTVVDSVRGTWHDLSRIRAAVLST